VTDRRPRSSGFTLIESLIVVSIMGIISASIAAIFVVIIRTTPSTEARADDSRSLLGISTWLPADVSATPRMPSASATANWDASAARASGCAGTDPGTNLLRLAWSEQTSSTPTFYAASYRLLQTATETSIVRVSCVVGAAAKLTTVTAGLPPAATNPVTTTWKTASISGVEYIVGVAMLIRTREGDTLRVDASSRNPDETLSTIPSGVTDPPTPEPSTTTSTSTTTTTTTISSGPTTSTTTLPNVSPTADPATYTGRRDSTITFTLPITDGDGDALVAAYDPIPDGWAFSQPDATNSVTVTATNPGAGTYALTYTVTDTDGASASSTITITLTAVPCAAAFASVVPNPAANTSHGNQTAPLLQPVVVTITRSGDCGNLTLRYRLVAPTSNPNDVEPSPNVDPFGASLSLTLASVATQRWEPGSRTLELVEFEGLANEVVHGTTSLVVN
jgi:prepilin-type N-terminal cleavage/methylation domain-containing protein